MARKIPAFPPQSAGLIRRYMPNTPCCLVAFRLKLEHAARRLILTVGDAWLLTSATKVRGPTTSACGGSGSGEANVPALDQLQLLLCTSTAYSTSGEPDTERTETPDDKLS
jgi:hypothetical protein